MVKKLYRHEFRDLLRFIPFAWIGVGGAALLAALSYCFNFKSEYPSGDDPIGTLRYELGELAVTGSSALLVLAIETLFILSLVLIVIRFYRTMLSSEGYLTHSLPFSTKQLFNCKLLCAFAVMLLNVLVCIAAVCLMGLICFTFFGSWGEFADFLGDFFYGIGDLMPYSAVIIFEIIVIGLLVAFLFVAFPLTCLSVGQRFRKRILVSVLLFVGVQWVLQFFSMVGFFIFEMMIFSFFDVLDPDPGATAALVLAVVMLIACGFCMLCYFLSRRMLTKKLNLV